MNSATWVALVAVAVAVTIPWLTFRLAMRQDHVRWIREQRTELYVAMLAEAYAEREWLNLETAMPETQERVRPFFTDTRLPQAERAQLGARGSILGSRTVNRLSNQISALAFALLMDRTNPNPDPVVIRMQIDFNLEGLIDELREAIRRELGADRVQLDAPPAPPE